LANLIGAGLARLRAASAGKAGASPIVGEWDGSETACAVGAKGSRAGKRRMNAAVPLKSNFYLRLEHEIQTGWGGSARSGRNFTSCSRHGATLFQQLGAPLGRASRAIPIVLISEGIGGLGPSSAPHLSGACLQQHMALERLESQIRLAPVIFLVSRGANLGGVPDCPNATQPEPFAVSTFFIRPHRVNWQVTCRIWVGGCVTFARSKGHFSQALSFS
jgi:hypothetical protein